MTFYDIQLPVDVERGAVGGPGFKTTILALSSGNERRNIDWQASKGSWDISYGITYQSQLQAVIDHHYVVFGRAIGFRFKDWTDFQIGNTITNDPTTKQSIGTGNGTNTVFQVFKQYNVSGFTFDRTIAKLVSGTVLVWVNGVLKTENVDYTVAYNSGIITFTTAPTNTYDVSVMLQFDVPVRFDSDVLNITAEVFANEGVIELPKIMIVEIRDID